DRAQATSTTATFLFHLRPAVTGARLQDKMVRALKWFHHFAHCSSAINKLRQVKRILILRNNCDSERFSLVALGQIRLWKSLARHNGSSFPPLPVSPRQFYPRAPSSSLPTPLPPSRAPALRCLNNEPPRVHCHPTRVRRSRSHSQSLAHL